MEEWRDVVGYEGVYSVSSFGRIRRDKAYHNTFVGKILAARKDRDGYLGVQLCKNNKAVSRKVHRLVLEAFIGPQPSVIQVNHKNGIKDNNNLSNLEYTNQYGNMRHAALLRLTAIGDRNGMAKLTWDIVNSIRTDYSYGFYKQKDLAEKYNITFQQIHMIVNNKTWRHA